MNSLVLWVAVFSFLGAICTALLGFLDQTPPEPFVFRKFAPSIIRAIVAAVGVAAAFNYANMTGAVGLLLAFLSGAGVDVAGNRIAGAIATKTKGSDS